MKRHHSNGRTLAVEGHTPGGGGRLPGGPTLSLSLGKPDANAPAGGGSAGSGKPIDRVAECEAAVAVYLNRLSDYLFVAARFAARRIGEEDAVYQKARVRGG